MAKKRLVKNYEALTPEILEDLKVKYPNGYEQHLIKYTDKDGKFVSALPFDTEEVYYLIRMTIQEAKRIDNAEYDDDDAIRSDMDIEVDAEFDGQGEEDDDLNDVDDESDHIIVTRRRGDNDDADDIADDSDY
ncbi:MAG: hypothetical protein RIR11_4630 [Bacteroidota bacterium]